MIARLAGLSCIVGLLHAGLAAQQPLASLSGVVVSDADGRTPIRRAIVTLTASTIVRNLSVVTDDQGRFAFVNLVAGNYTVSVSKAAYLPRAYGAKQSGRAGTAIALAAGQQVTGLSVALERGAVLTGTVREDSGRPAPNIAITIIPTSRLNEPGTLEYPADGPLRTDDRGMYRAYGLAPGEYIVAASVTQLRTNTLSRPSAASIDVALRALEQRGPVRTAVAAPPPDVVELGYAPVFYPGTPVAADALRVRVTAGQVRDGLDFLFAPVSSHHVAGRIVTVDGSQLPAVQLSLTLIGPRLPTLLSTNPFIGAGLDQQADGTFVFSAVAPGHYALVAHGTPGTAPIDTRASSLSFSSATTGALWALTEVTVTDADVTGVTVAMQPTVTLSGQVRFDSTILPPKDLSAIHVGLIRATTGTAALSAHEAAQLSLDPPRPGAANGDGTFSVTNISAGRYTMQAALPGWWLRSAMVQGHDVLDTGVDFGNEPTAVTNAVLTFTDRPSGLSGSLQSESGRPAPQYLVVIFPADRAMWAATRRLRSTRPTSDGSFAFAELPAGDYLVAALTDLDPETWQTPSVLEQLLGTSVKVTIADGAMTQQNVRIR